MIITLNIDGIDREFEQEEDGRLTTVAPKTNLRRVRSDESQSD